MIKRIFLLIGIVILLFTAYQFLTNEPMKYARGAMTEKLECHPYRRGYGAKECSYRVYYYVDGKTYETIFYGIRGNHYTNEETKVYYDPKIPQKGYQAEQRHNGAIFGFIFGFFIIICGYVLSFIINVWIQCFKGMFNNNNFPPDNYEN